MYYNVLKYTEESLMAGARRGCHEFVKQPKLKLKLTALDFGETLEFYTLVALARLALG